jgi:hypothetical protein
MPPRQIQHHLHGILLEAPQALNVEKAGGALQPFRMSSNKTQLPTIRMSAVTAVLLLEAARVGAGVDLESRLGHHHLLPLAGLQTRALTGQILMETKLIHVLKIRRMLLLI